MSAAQSGYEIRNAAVTPEYGYEDFSYTAQVWMSEEVARQVGLIAVTKFSMKLNIYDRNQEVYSESSPSQTGMSQTSFSFGPYSFKDKFVIASTSNATFEFIFYAGGQQVAKTARIKGPIVQPPTLTGTPSFEKKPYFFQGISVSAGFKDLEGLSPKPTCHLEITGPLGTADSRSWTTADVSCQSSGKSTYSCSVAEDLSSYRTGGNFTFKLVYNNLKVDPLTYGPYNISLQPYNPTLEKVTIPKLLDYTNFTIQAYVKDAGAKMIGGIPDGSVAKMIISHPQKGEMAYDSSEPKMQGSSLVYEWTNDIIPAIFNRSDVQLSKNAPFQARVVYKNENWDYQAEKSNITFKVVEEIPKLDLQYPSTVYVRTGESPSQDIIATVTFSKGSGDMNLRLSGPDQDLNLTEKGVSLGGNRYQYKWQVAFDDRHINNNYTLALSFVHPMLEGGRYAFEDKFIRVSPLSVQFSEGLVSPTTGLWNGSYTYSLKIDTTIVPLEVRLQTYDPCSSEWTDKSAKKATVESSRLNWTVQPFGYECKEMQQEGAKFRFKASFAGNDYISKPYSGPTFKGGSPVLISLDSDPVVYVSEGSESSSSIQAVVEYGAGQGQAVLRLTGPEKSIEETSQGMVLGGNRYRYDWSLPFEEVDIGKSFNYTINYKHPSMAAEIQLAEKSIAVKTITIDFGDATVAPVKGKWNETYTYSVPVKSSVDMKVGLEVYNPCSFIWVQRASGKVQAGETILNLNAAPFKSRCADSDGVQAKFRYTASFADKTYESEVYAGPTISGGQPKLVSLDYAQVLYVTEERLSYQVIRALVESPLGPAKLSLLISPKMDLEQETSGVSMGGTRYSYSWSIPFGLKDVGNHTISLSYIHRDIPGGKIAFLQQSMRVMKEDEELSGKPQLLNFNYTPILFTDGNRDVLQNITIQVFSPVRKGQLRLSISENGKNVHEVLDGVDKGGNIYEYSWSESFNSSDVGKNFKISTSYLITGESYAFEDRIMSVVRKDGMPPQIWEPSLSSLEYDRTVFIPSEGTEQIIEATINYTQGMGRLKINLTGPDGIVLQDASDGASLGSGRYRYEWTVPFTSADIDKDYTVSLSYVHPTLTGEEYRFADRYFQTKRASGSTEGEIKFASANVTPANGSTFTAFTYCVNVESKLKMRDIELFTQEPGSTKWISQGTIPYNGTSQVLCWPDVVIDGAHYGTAKYRFSSGTSTSDILTGPNIEQMSFINATISPTHGPLYITTPLMGEISRVYIYTIAVEFMKPLAGNMKEVRLEVYDPSSESWLYAGSQTYDASKTKLTFKINFAGLPFQEPFVGETKYRLLASGEDLGEFSGPTIDVNLRNEQAIAQGRNYTYQLEVRSSLPKVDIALAYTTNNVNWLKGDKRTYESSSEEWKLLKWEKYPKHYAYEFEVAYA